MSCWCCGADVHGGGREVNGGGGAGNGGFSGCNGGGPPEKEKAPDKGQKILPAVQLFSYTAPHIHYG